MKQLKAIVAFTMALLVLVPTSLFASSHREAPISALDHSADVTDWYAFVSYDHPDRVTMILNVDGFLEPSNGPNYFPFDPNVLYEMKVDNNHDGIEDITFQFRFNTQVRQPGVFTGFVGGIGGFPQITALDGPGSEGLSLRQTYTVTMIKNGVATDLCNGHTLFAVPSNVGPLTMPKYNELFKQGIYDLDNDVRVFAGTVDDPFYIDLGAAFDSFNFRMGVGGILTPAVDGDDTHNYAPDAVAGFNVNSIVLEVPITMLTVDGKGHPATDKNAVIGTYGATYRQRITIRRTARKVDDTGDAIHTEGPWRQVNREGNSLINELIIGTGFKDRFSVDDPANDGQCTSEGLPLHRAGVVPRGRKAFSNARDGGTRGLKTVPCRWRQPAIASLLGNPSLTYWVPSRAQKIWQVQRSPEKKTGTGRHFRQSVLKRQRENNHGDGAV